MTAGAPGPPSVGPERHIVSRDLGDTTVLLNLSTGTYLALTGSGGDLWRRYADTGYDTAVASASVHFGVPPERIRADLDRLLREVQTLRAERAPARPRLRRPPLRRVLAARPAELLALARAAAIAGAVEAGLRASSLSRVTRMLGVGLATAAPGAPVRAGASAGSALTPREREDLRAAERVFRFWPFEATCLRRALVAARLLRRRGAVVHLGVAESAVAEGGRRAGDGPIAAHAWVEAGELQLLALPGYERLVRAGG